MLKVSDPCKPLITADVGEIKLNSIPDVNLQAATFNRAEDIQAHVVALLDTASARLNGAQIESKIPCAVLFKAPFDRSQVIDLLLAECRAKSVAPELVRSEVGLRIGFRNFAETQDSERFKAHILTVLKVDDFFNGSHRRYSKAEFAEALGDRTFGNELFARLDPIIKSLASRISNQHRQLDFNEVLGSVRSAVFMALREYDPARNNIVQFVFARAPLRLTDEMRTKTKRGVYSGHRDLEELSHMNDSEISQKLGISETRINDLRNARKIRGAASLNFSDGDERGISDHRPGPGADLEARDFRAVFLCSLPPRERRIFELRELGFGMKEIGAVFEVTDSRISMILGAVAKGISDGDWSHIDRSASVMKAGLGSDVLQKEIKLLGLKPQTLNDVIRYVDGVDFFADLASTRSRILAPVRDMLTEEKGFFIESLPASSGRLVADTVKTDFPSLMDIRAHRFFSSYFNIDKYEPSLSEVIKGCVRYRLYDMKAELPRISQDLLGIAGRYAARVRMMSAFSARGHTGLQAEVDLMKRQALRRAWRDLSGVTKESLRPLVCAALELSYPSTVEDALQALIKKKIFSPRVPRGLTPPRDMVFQYHRKGLIPERIRIRNILRTVKEQHPSLDTFPYKDAAMATALECGNTKHEMLSALFKLDPNLARLSKNFSLSTTHIECGSIYFDQKFVGKAQAIENANEFLRQLNRGLDDFGAIERETRILLSVLGLKNNRDLAKYRIEHGLSAEIPEGTPLTQGDSPHVSFYFDAYVVGPQNADANLTKALGYLFKSPKDVVRSKVLAKLLECECSRPAILAALEARGHVYSGLSS